MKKVNSVFPRITSTQVIEEITKVLEELNNSLTKVSIEQQKKYNLWAMDKIRTGYQKAYAHLGAVYDDKEDLEKLMFNWFGSIDVRLLTTDAQRCYSEIFNYLFNKLKGPR